MPSSCIMGNIGSSVLLELDPTGSKSQDISVSAAQIWIISFLNMSLRSSSILWKCNIKSLDYFFKLVLWRLVKIYRIFDLCYSCSIKWLFPALVWHKFILTLKSLQPVEVCVPYHRTKRREVVVQKFDGQSWSTLPTVLRRGSESHSSHPGGRPARVKYKTCHCKIIFYYSCM